MPYEFIESHQSSQIDISLPSSETTDQLRADITIYDYKLLRLWGQILTTTGHPISHALVQLMKVLYQGATVNFTPIAHTTSDEEGYYQFDVHADDTFSYKILVSKPANEHLPPVEFCMEDIKSPTQTLPNTALLTSSGYLLNQNRLYAKLNYKKGD